MNRLTLCLIARDEAELLGGCLDSVQGAVDAVVVVDTGSRDGTAALAERTGGLVVHHEWLDDFAGARNAALEQVQDGYVLILDADERLAPGAGHTLRKLVERGKLDGALLPFHDAGAPARCWRTGRPWWPAGRPTAGSWRRSRPCSWGAARTCS